MELFAAEFFNVVFGAQPNFPAKRVNFVASCWKIVFD
jgi:hypothetical protein